MENVINDNDRSLTGSCRRTIEPYGEAALLLSESLLHGLIANSLLSVTQAVDIVDTALEVSHELAGEDGKADGRIRSLALLTDIRSSLARDLPNEEN